MNRSRRLISWVAAAAAMVCFGGILTGGWFLARPASQIVGAAPSDLGAEVVTVPVSEGRAIRGWFVPGTPGAGAVLLLHPVRGNRTSMVSRARFLHADGRAVLLVDLQAHGESPGRRITFGARESEDAHAALAYLRSRTPNERTGAIGWSLGGAAALLGREPLPVDALVLEAVYPTIGEAVADRLRIRVGPLGPVIAPLLTSQLRLWTDVGVDALRPIDAIGRTHAAVLIIAGERDPRTRLEESQRLFAAAPEPKELWVVPGAGHDDYHDVSTATYEARVRRFLNAHLAARLPAP